MTPDGAVQLLDLYARIQGAIERDETEEADALLAQADALITEPPPPGSDVAVLLALAVQVQAARSDAETAMITARDQLLRSASLELRTGGDGARAYAGNHERPAARFIDRTG
jgi:hypothetical protein